MSTVKIETSTLLVEVHSIDELLEMSARTPVSDLLAKKFKHNPEDSTILNGNLIVRMNEHIIFVYDFFTKERKMYDFKFVK